MSKKYNFLLIVLAGCLWGTLGIFVRKFNEYGITSMSIVFVRSLLTAVCVLGAGAVFCPGLLKFRLKDIWIFSGMGLCSIVLFNYCYFKAVTLMSLSAAAILLYTSPIFVMLMSAMFFREKITVRKIISAVVSLAGLILVTGFIGDAETVTPNGLIYGIGSAAGYALYSIFNRAAINKGYSALAVTGWSFAFAAVFSVMTSDIKSISGMFSENRAMIGYALIFSICASVLPNIFYSIGLKGTENSTAAVVASAEPVAATLFGMIIYKEIPSVSALIGIAVVIAAMFMITGSKSTDK